jgi:hypothetical protein
MRLPNRNPSRPDWKIQRRENVLWRITLKLADDDETVEHYLVADNDCLTLQDVLDIYHDDELFLADALANPHTPYATCCYSAPSNSASSTPSPSTTNAPPANRQMRRAGQRHGANGHLRVVYESVLQFTLR